MRKRTSIAGLALLMWALAIPGHAYAEDVMVFAAASLTDVLEELAKSWETTPGEIKDTMRFNFGASSDLARQIKAGAPADVFFSADVARMEELEQAGLIDRGERQNVLSNLLVVVVPKASTLEVTSLLDLTKVEKLALANPDAVPAGVYARRFLESQGLWSALVEKVVPTVDVRAALAAVVSESVDAAIVYRTDAAISERVRVAIEIARTEGPPIVYALAPLKSPRNARARDVVRFLASKEAARVYERFGFIVLTP
jgi:molybdate transport system substrate-binding protein